MSNVRYNDNFPNNGNTRMFILFLALPQGNWHNSNKFHNMFYKFKVFLPKKSHFPKFKTLLKVREDN